MLGNFIAGEWIDGLHGNPITVVNPATGTAISDVQSADSEDVGRAVDAAAAAFPAWSRRTPGERARVVLDLADLLDRNADELGRLESVNVGKPVPGAIEEMTFTADCLRFIAGAARIPDGQAAGEYMTGHTSFLRRDPIGVCGQISPWNYPLHIALVKSAQALVVGNTVVAKPSELTPLTLLRFAELAAEILPPGVLNVVTGDGVPTGEAIVVHPMVRGIGFTGDVHTGRTIAAAAAPTLKRLALELGGKSPVLVFADADLGAVAEMLKGGAFGNSGQDCQAASRVLVEARAYDDFMAALLERVGTLVMGDPAEQEDIDLGPVVSATQQERVLGFVDRATSAGASVLAGGSAGRPRGFFVEPTVIGDVDQHAEIVQREVFGPVVTVQRFTDEGQALAFANGVDYGLSSSVWTGDPGRAMRVGRAIQCGTVWINTHFASTPEMPHGGFNQSGYGKDYSRYGLEEWTVVKHVAISHGAA